MATLIALSVAIGIVALVVVVALVSTARRRSIPPPRTTDRGEVAGGGVVTRAPAPSADTGERVAPPGTVEAPPTEAPVAPTPPDEAALLEIPEPTAGRLTRLRARLARSQGTLGRGLLALLSRDTLDEDTWEEIEDTLLTADVGVAATQQLVENLRTRVRVLGTRSPEEVRTLLR